MNAVPIDRPPGFLIEIDGLGTHVVVAGSGPPVLLMAALGSNWFDLDQMADALAASFTVIRYDRPGYGVSEPFSRDAFPTLQGEIDRMAGFSTPRESTSRSSSQRTRCRRSTPRGSPASTQGGPLR